MAAWEAAEMSFFSLSDVRERMREKKKGALRTAKLNASLASKIKTKIINNSTMKVSLKQNNKALALALNAEKANAQRLTQEKTILQKEVKQCHFQNAVLRHRLSFLNNMLKKMENLMAAVKMAELSEFHINSSSLSSGQKSIMTEDSWADDIVDGQLLRVTQIPMRVPISKLHDAEQQAGSSTALQTSSGELQRPASSAGEFQRPASSAEELQISASNEALKIAPVTSKDALPPQHDEKSQFCQEENGKKVTEAVAAEGAFHDSHIFGEVLCSTEQNPNNLLTLALESHTLSYEADEMAKHFLDRLSQGHVTQRRKRSTLFATSTPSSTLDIFPHVSSTQASWGSSAQDNNSSSKNNTQQQLRSPSPLASPAQTAVISHRNSVGKETFCEQPQTKEIVCCVETDPSYSRVPEFDSVKVKSKGKCKTGEKKTVKKVRTGKKKTTAIKNNAESSPDRSQVEERAQNAKLLQPEVATCSSETEVCEMGQKVCEGASDRRSRDCGVEHHSHSPDGVQDFGSTNEVNPAQLQGLESVDLMQQVKKGPIFEMQSMESLLKPPARTFSSHQVPSGDSSLQNSTKFSSVSRKSIRQKANRKTRVIGQRHDSDEEYLPNIVIIPDSKAEERPKRSTTSRKSTARNSNCDQRNEVNVFRPCIDVQGVANESTKDLPGNLKQRRETYIVHPLDLAGNLGCFQTESEGSENLPPRSVPGNKVSKIPRAVKSNQKSNKKQTGGHQKNGQGEVDHNMNGLTKEASCKPRPQQKRSSSQPPETDSLARKSDGAKVLIGSSTELASKQTIVMGKFSCISHLLSEPGDFLEEQLPEVSLADSLTDLPHSLESSHVSSCAVLSVSSRLTEVPVSKSLSTEGNKMPAKPPVQLKNSLIFKENTAEEIPGERNQVQSSSCSSPSQEPDIRPLQDLNNTRVLSLSSSEEESGRSSRRKWKPTCYKEPSVKRKLRQGDTFTDTEFLHSSLNKRKMPVKAKGTTKKMKENKEWLPEGCLSTKEGKVVTTERISTEFKSSPQTPRSSRI
ncbi:uncharacterized protein LOC103814714 [Serinus canaria]|uniref:uncharacterized protein LOC103814714 n=1 Tax=Serinus canaria TaxID=9135 RepID=UPI0021CC9D33|nr:uncharacterized protein LOC103814714 [Serinus canaria]